MLAADLTNGACPVFNVIRLDDLAAFHLVDINRHDLEASFPLDTENLPLGVPVAILRTI